MAPLPTRLFARTIRGDVARSVLLTGLEIPVSNIWALANAGGNIQEPLA